jgi:hypothetical protein
MIKEEKQLLGYMAFLLTLAVGCFSLAVWVAS